MNWWDIIKASFAADDDWEHFDPAEHDIRDYLAARGRRDMELPSHISDEPIEPTAGDIIEDILSTQDEPTGQGGTGPPRGPGEDRPVRGQTAVAPSRPMGLNRPIIPRGTGREQSEYAGPQRNTPLPPPRESGSSTSHLPRAQSSRFPLPLEEAMSTLQEGMTEDSRPSDVQGPLEARDIEHLDPVERERRAALPPIDPMEGGGPESGGWERSFSNIAPEDMDRAMEALERYGSRPEPSLQERWDAMGEHPGSLMDEEDLIDAEITGRTRPEQEMGEQTVQDLLDEGEDMNLHEVSGVSPSGQTYPVELQGMAKDPASRRHAPPWEVSDIEEASRTGEIPADTEFDVDDEGNITQTVRGRVNPDLMDEVTSRDDPTAERRVHTNLEPAVEALFEGVNEQGSEALDLDDDGNLLTNPLDAAEKRGTFTGIPWSEETGFTRGESMTPFNVAWELMKDISHLQGAKEHNWDQYISSIYNEMLTGNPAAREEWELIQQQDPESAAAVLAHRPLNRPRTVGSKATFEFAPTNPEFIWPEAEEGGVTERIPTNQVGVTTSPSADLQAQATHHGFEFDENGNLVMTSKKKESDDEPSGSIMDLVDE